MAKDIIEAYKDVCMNLKGLRAYEPIVRLRLEAAHKVFYGGRMPSSGSICYVPLDTSIPEYNAAIDEFNETMKTIDQLETVKAQLESIIAKMSEPEQVVITLHIEQGLNLRQIAEKSNYSYIHIRRIASQLRSKQTAS